MLVLAVGGHEVPVAGIVVGFVLLLLSLHVEGVTEPARSVIVAAGRARRRVWAQLGLVAVVIALTGWNGLAFHKVIDGDTEIPLWSPMVGWLRDLGEQWFGEGLGTFLANPVTYVAIPLVVLLLAGACPSTLGFARGHRVGRALLICCALPVAWLAFTLVSGQQAIVRLLGIFASNFMQDGFLEEFLFRASCKRGCGFLEVRVGRWLFRRSCSASGTSGPAIPTPVMPGCRRP